MAFKGTMMVAERIAVAAAAATIALSLSASVAAAADDGYQDVFSSVLTAVGVLNADKTPEIDYRERAPLVLPPKMNLTKPTAPGSARTAAWPQDPDVLKRRKASEEARAPMPNILGNSSDTLTKDELKRGRTTTAEAAGVPESAERHDRCGNEGNKCLVLSPAELKALSDRYEASGEGEKPELAAGVEPERVYLTQPPKGYLKTTKTMKATTEAPEPKIDAANPNSELVYRKPKDEE